jgi:hypothetical protein
MVEAKERCAHFDDIEESTFSRFVEFAYTGAYSVPDPKILPLPSDIASRSSRSLNALPANVESIAAPNHVDVDTWGVSSDLPPRKKKKKACNTKRWYDEDQDSQPLPAELVPDPHISGFDDTFGESPKRQTGASLWQSFMDAAHVRTVPPWKPYINWQSREDYGPVLLCHASLYVFSDRWSIRPLRDLVLQKLRLTFSEFVLFEERTGDVVDLLRYTYANTQDLDDGMDKLRLLVSDFIVCHIDTIAKDENFLDLLQEPGPIAKDLVLKLLVRLG